LLYREREIITRKPLSLSLGVSGGERRNGSKVVVIL